MGQIKFESPLFDGFFFQNCCLLGESFIRLLGPFEIILDNLRNFDVQNLQNLFAIYPKLKGQQYLKKNV